MTNCHSQKWRMANVWKLNVCFGEDGPCPEKDLRSALMWNISLQSKPRGTLNEYIIHRVMIHRSLTKTTLHQMVRYFPAPIEHLGNTSDHSPMPGIFAYPEKEPLPQHLNLTCTQTFWNIFNNFSVENFIHLWLVGCGRIFLFLWLGWGGVGWPALPPSIRRQVLRTRPHGYKMGPEPRVANGLIYTYILCT